MWETAVSTWHLDLALAAALAGAVAAVGVSLLGRSLPAFRAAGSATVGAIASLVVLAGYEGLRWEAAPLAAGSTYLWVTAIAAAPSPGRGPVSDRRVPMHRRTLPSWASDIALLIAVAATWACAPDTEGPVALGGAIAAATFAGALTGRLGPPRTRVTSHDAPPVPLVASGVVLLVGLSAFQGRMAGAWALIPIGVAALCGPVRPPTIAGSTPRLVASLAVSAVGTLVAARTVGLAASTTPRGLAATGALAAVVALAWAVPFGFDDAPSDPTAVPRDR